jgi:uncharacterized protein YjiS (DUF1127 family)
MNESNSRRPADLCRFEVTLRSAAWVWVGRAFAAVIARHRMRQTIRALSATTDRQLFDIGLRRGDIKEVAARTASFRA